MLECKTLLNDLCVNPLTRPTSGNAEDDDEEVGMLLASFSNRGLYGYKVYLHEKDSAFSYEWFRTWPPFEKKAKSNSEMGYSCSNTLYILTANIKSSIWQTVRRFYV